MKKLLLLSAFLIFACSSDDSSNNDENSNQTFLERYADVVWEDFYNEYRFSLNLNGYTQGDDTFCEEYIWGQETDGFITFNILENNYDNLVVSLSADSVIYQVVYEVSTDENIITTSIFSDEDVIIDTSTASRTSLLVPCNDDDNNDPVNEEEVITTMTVTLTPDNGSTAVVLEYRDLDGEGEEVPIITVSGDLIAGATYNGSILVLNETENPAENLSEEIEEEGDEHQFFFVVGGGLEVTTSYNDMDLNGNPIGLSFTLNANSASSGDFTVTLIHEPIKPNNGISDAGGSTDIEVTFPITIE